MAVILEFRRSEDAAALVAKLPEGSLGEIIIFPGVRIERRTARKPSRQVPVKRRAQRSRKKSS